MDCQTAVYQIMSATGWLTVCATIAAFAVGYLYAK